MVADAFALAMDAINELDQFDSLDDESGFFEDFAGYGCNERFAHFDEAAGKRPVALHGFGPALHQEHAALMDDDRANTDERTGRKFSLQHLEPRTNIRFGLTITAGACHWAEDYDHVVIKFSQFMNGMWMGTILLALGLVPGLPDRCMRGISDSANFIFLRSPLSFRLRFPSRLGKHIAFRQPRWLAALGLAVIVASVFAFVAQ
jgi:hypothetical protein